jgi:hypothetical protein
MRGAKTLKKKILKLILFETLQKLRVENSIALHGPQLGEDLALPDFAHREIRGAEGRRGIEGDYAQVLLDRPERVAGCEGEVVA